MLSLFSLLFPQVIQLDRVRHRVLGGARMVDVTGCLVAVPAAPLSQLFAVAAAGAPVDSGRSPHVGGQRPVPHQRCWASLRCCSLFF